MFNSTNLDAIQNSSGLGFSFANSDPGEIITALLPYIYGVAGIILIVNIVSAGYGMMTSQGDPKALQAAQQKLSNSAIGTVVLFASFWIVQVIMRFLGINIILFR